MPRLTTNNAIRYIKNNNIDFDFDNKITIEHNKVYSGAVAILINGIVYSLRDSFSELSNVVLNFTWYTKHFKSESMLNEKHLKVKKLYDELSGKDESKQFWS